MMRAERKQRILCSIADDNGEYYYNGPLDGVWGPESQKAADRFLQDFAGDNVPDINVGNKTNKDTNIPTKTGTFWDKIEYFTRDEFRCKCGGKYCNGFPAEPQEQLVRIADQLRKNLGVPITIISGLRCPTWNKIQGGVENSQHMYGEAADIYARGMSQLRVETELDNIGGVRYHYAISGSSNVHLDIPKGKR